MLYTVMTSKRVFRRHLHHHNDTLICITKICWANVSQSKNQSWLLTIIGHWLAEFLLAVDDIGPDGTYPSDGAARGDPRQGSCVGSPGTISRDWQASEGVQWTNANVNISMKGHTTQCTRTLRRCSFRIQSVRGQYARESCKDHKNKIIWYRSLSSTPVACAVFGLQLIMEWRD